MGSLKSALAWFHTPFQQPMDPIHIGLLVGIVLISFLLWSRVLAHLNLE
jgi:hypothetical protein